ncbi:MAG: PEP-CTERM sorting domain-containing protein [Kiritimatiellae bacterium]|jgi:hypothetical protein|nr:PEP-CTERM sorting domain-containing protein [Kiritimatiellia bacterium]
MKKLVLLNVMLLTTAGLSRISAAPVLLIDPSTSSGVSTSLTGTTPYTVAAGSSWNQGAATYPSTLEYSDGSDATGVSAVADVTSSGSGWTLEFDSPSLNSFQGSIGSGVFADDPAEDAIYANVSGNGPGFLGMRITDLDFGTYDIYAAAAYIGSTSSNRPGGSTPSQQALWIFSGTTDNNLAYDPLTGQITGGGASGLAASEVLENSITSTWTENDNFGVIRVTVDASNPTLYVATSGDDFYNNNTADQRAWLNLVEVVTIPEPSTALLLFLSLAACLVLRRRRNIV